MSTFSGLNGALSSLYAQRRGLDVAGQNIANANTEGYTRQRVNMAAVGPSPIPAMYATPDGSASGVTVTDVTRVRDTYLEVRGRVEHAQNEYLAGQSRVYGLVQKAFGEPGENGLQAQLSQFWHSWDDLANSPGNAAARTQVLALGQTVSGTLRGTHENFSSLYNGTREQMSASVDDINAAAKQVAQLNQAIMSATQSGMPTNELADQRDTVIMHLSELTGATAVNRPNGIVDVYVGGSPLVNNLTTRELAVSGSGTLDGQSADPVSLTWADTGLSAGVSSGSLASSLETLNTTLPKYTAAMDKVAASLAQAVNDQHATGFDLSGNPGGEFFTGNNGNPVTAATIKMAISETDLLAASATGGDLNGDNADLMAGITSRAGGPDTEYRQLIVDLGTATQTVTRRAGVQATLTTDLDAARQSDSGVNLDEEMANLIQYQRAYEAASKVINAIDSMLDTLINRIGS